MALLSVADSNESSLRFASLVSSSGPWHEKHFPESNGLISRLKLTSSSAETEWKCVVNIATTTHNGLESRAFAKSLLRFILLIPGFESRFVAATPRTGFMASAARHTLLER